MCASLCIYRVGQRLKYIDCNFTTLNLATVSFTELFLVPKMNKICHLKQITVPGTIYNFIQSLYELGFCGPRYDIIIRAKSMILVLGVDSRRVKLCTGGHWNSRTFDLRICYSQSFNFSIRGHSLAYSRFFGKNWLYFMLILIIFSNTVAPRYSQFHYLR